MANLYEVRQGGTLIGQYVSAQRAIAFLASGRGQIDVTVATGFQDPPTSGAFRKSCTLHSPTAGEVFIRPVGFKLIASANDVETVPIKMEWYLDNGSTATLLATVNASTTDEDGFSQDSHTFVKTLTGLTPAAGTYTIYARSYHGGTGSLILNSPPRTITIIDPPTYGTTLTLSANLDLTSGATSLVGTSGSRIKVDGQNLYKVIGTPSSINAQYCDFIRCGPSGDYAIDLTTTGTVTWENNRHWECKQGRVTHNGSTAASVKSNLWASNFRGHIGQLPELQQSDFCWQWAGTSSGAKVFEANNSTSSHYFTSGNWTIGGTTVAKANVIMGPRAGVWLNSSFTGTIQRNYLEHDYPPYWSQGSVLELSAVSTLTLEHCVIVGSSWPVRMISGTCRYNLIWGIAGMEAAIWTPNGGTAPSIHHNLIYAPECNPGRGAYYQIYSITGTAALRNNTFHLPHFVGSDSGSYLDLDAGALALDSNLIIDARANAVQINGGTLTADYNHFQNPAGALYSDGRGAQAHDTTGSAGLALIYPNYTPQWSRPAVWARTTTVADILSTARSRYAPSNATVLTGGNTATFGANNPKGAIGNGTNASDLFGVGV